MGSMLSSVVPETDIEGYQILQVYENSPAEKAGLEAFFDFIVALCGVVFIGNDEIFLNILQNNKDIPIDMKVFSIKTNTFRNVRITPSADWGSQDLLGVTINFCAIKDAYSFTYHVLEVQENSPADIAGLRPFTDYIFGAETDKGKKNVDFITLIKEYDQRNIKLFVYNLQDNASRSVTLTPNSKWNGNAPLGCDIGTGYLHRIPLTMNPVIKNANQIQSTNEKKLMNAVSTVSTQTAGLTLPCEQSTNPIDASACKVTIKNEAKKKSPKKSMPKTSPTVEETVA